jgi:hypothetical protein
MGGGESVGIRFEAGGSMGDLYASAFQRNDDGKILVSDEGMPRKMTTQELMGNVEPDFALGWNNNVSIGKFNVSALFTGKIGGIVVSQAEAMLDGYGVSKRTGDARDQGFLEVDAVNENDGSAVTQVDPQTWFLATGDRNGIMEYYVYDRTNVRLSQLAVSYTLNLSQSTFLENITLSVYGRNLFFLYKEAPFDPELVMSTNRNNQGLDNFNLPTTRSIGFNLNINF